MKMDFCGLTGAIACGEKDGGGTLGSCAFTCERRQMETTKTLIFCRFIFRPSLLLVQNRFRHHRLPRHMSRSRLRNGDVVHLERLTDGLIESDFSVRVIGHGLDLQSLVRSQVVLGLDDEGGVGYSSVLKPFLLRFEVLFRERARIYGSL